MIHSGIESSPYSYILFNKYTLSYSTTVTGHSIESSFYTLSQKTFTGSKTNTQVWKRIIVDKTAQLEKLLYCKSREKVCEATKSTTINKQATK